MACVALLANTGRSEAVSLADQVVEWLTTRGHIVTRLDSPALDPTGMELSGMDLAVSMGGDGTFLKLVQPAHAAGVPVMGVNFGRLGYLLEIQPPRVLEALERALAGTLTFTERAVVEISAKHGLVSPSRADRSMHESKAGAPVESDVDGERSWVVLNEMVVEKAVPGHVVNLATTIDGEPGLTYMADGVLVATPTGSTAYNLSAGGPALAPSLRAMILTPIAPHRSIGHSLVLHPDQVVRVRVLPPRPAVLVVDGREVGSLSPENEVTCRVAADPLRVASFGDRDFARMLRTSFALEQER